MAMTGMYRVNEAIIKMLFSVRLGKTTTIQGMIAMTKRRKRKAKKTMNTTKTIISRTIIIETTTITDTIKKNVKMISFQTIKPEFTVKNLK